MVNPVKSYKDFASQPNFRGKCRYNERGMSETLWTRGGDFAHTPLCEEQPLASEFDKLSKGTKLEVAAHVFGKIKTLERGSNDFLENMGDLVTENNEL